MSLCEMVVLREIDGVSMASQSAMQSAGTRPHLRALKREGRRSDFGRELLWRE